ncbi:MAG: glycoside hydrolase family 2 TIM barrel-domain containing protein [Verrucomicrobiota bacterium]
MIQTNLMEIDAMIEWNTNIPTLFRAISVAAVIVCFSWIQEVAMAVSPLAWNCDSDWRFSRVDIAGAEKIGFDDSSWRKVEVPHDWSIEEPFAKTNKTGGAGAWAAHGVGWYRKHFTIDPFFKDMRVWVNFDGVMQNSEVWVNGVSLGKRPNGYVSFGYDLTPHVKFGDTATNVIAVRTDASAQPASRWYSGAGIYRHVNMCFSELVHFEPDAIFITTPDVRTNEATVRVMARVKNDATISQEIEVEAEMQSPPWSAQNGVYAGSGKSPKISLAAGKTIDVAMEVKIVGTPRLWTLGQPELYRARVLLRAGNRGIGEERIKFGIRQAEFKADSGFWLNGKNLKLKGVCLHHDGSAFGAAVPLSVWERRLTNLRELGVNAIRTAHNPVAPEFLDLCDRMGFLVMDEFFDCWTVGKNPQDYHLYFEEWSKRDAADTIRRDRNHPSVILYSIGNEIHDTPKPKIAIPIARGLVEVCHENDPTRPVTQALFRPNVSGDYTNGLADLLDVLGTNYRDNELLAAQRDKPERKIVGTEQRHDRQTWLWLRDNLSHSGQFLWTGVDYLGETKTWPRIGHPSGLLDRTAGIKPMAFERQSWWSTKPMVRMARRVAADDVLLEDPGYGGEERHTQVQFADWTPRKSEPHDENVEVFSNCDEVELFLNGKSLGVKPINKDASPRVWKVAYEPGTLRAVARNTGSGVASDELRTAGPPSKIVLTTHRSSLRPVWDEVAFVTATVVDEKGVVLPRANDVISFQVNGPGVIAVVDSADNASIEPFQAKQRRAYQGRCEAAVRATGAGEDIIVMATAAGLGETKISIETKAND